MCGAVDDMSLFVGDNDALRRWSKLHCLAAREAGVLEHPFVLAESVCITLRGAGQRDHAKACVYWRRYAVIVRNKAQRDRPAARRQRGVDFSHEAIDGLDIQE